MLVAALFVAGCTSQGPQPLAGELIDAGSIGAAGSNAPKGGAEVESSLAAAAPVLLTGTEEVPGPGHPEASGSVVIELVSERNEVCVDLDVTGLDSPTAVHLHESPAGGAGDVVLALPAPDGGDGSVSACVSAPAALLERLRSTPMRFYVNVHSDAHPDGAIRGQLR